MRRAASETLGPLLDQLLLKHLQQQRQAMTTTAAMAASRATTNGICRSSTAVPVASSSSLSLIRQTTRRTRALISPRYPLGNHSISCRRWLSRPLASYAPTSSTSQASFSSSALPAVEASRSEAEDDDRAPAAGRLVEFLTKGGGSGSSSSSPSTSFALVLEPDGKRNWFAVDARGTRHSLKPAQITYVFPDDAGAEPGASSPDATLRLAVLKEAADAAERAAAPGSDDLSLLRDAWEMTKVEEGAASPPPLLTAPALADLLYGDSSSPATIASVLRLMSSSSSGGGAEDDARTLFKQVGRRPPAWSPRSEADVRAIRGAARAAEAAAEAMASAAEVLRDAAAASAAASPSLQTPEQWLSGPHAKFVEALDAFALEKATQAQASLAQGVLRALGPLPAQLSSALMESVVVGALSGSSPSAPPSASPASPSSPPASPRSIRAPFPPTSDGAAALLSAVGFRPRHEIPSLRRAGLTEEFSPELEASAAALLDAGSPSPGSDGGDPDARWRLDLTGTHRFVVAIDDAATTEVDDAISVERAGPEGDEGSGPARGRGTPVALWVHVADPTRWLTRPGHVLAREASRRTRTLYLPTGSLPMFPRSAAEGLFSLSRDGERGVAPGSVPAFSVRLPVLPDGTRDESLEATLHVTRIRPATRMTYEQADAVLGGGGARAGDAGEGGRGPDGDAADDLAVVAAFADSRLASRMARGAASFDLPELCVTVRDRGGGAGGLPGSPVSIELSQLWSGASASRRAVAEAMIAANEGVALWGGRHGVPLPYRGQPESIALDSDGPGSDSPLGEAGDGGKRDDGGKTGGVEKTSEGETTSAADLVAAHARLFSSQRSTLSTEAPSKHSGLGLDAYVQSTSPIRRYSDLVAHWQAKAKLRQLRSSEERGDHSSPHAPSPGDAGLPWPDPASLSAELSDAAETARELSRAERAATAHWVGRYFAEASSAGSRRGEEKPTWDATLVSWVRKETGVARALLRDVGVEATLRVSGPAKLGDVVTVAHAGTDEVSGGPLFEDVSRRSGGGGGGEVAVASAAVVSDEQGEIDVVVEDEEEEVVDDDDEDSSSAVVPEGVDAEK